MRDELLKEFFALGGNYKNFDKAKDLEKRINSYLEERPNDLHILDVSRLFRVYTTEFELEDFEGACKLAFPIIKRLLNLSISKWELYDIRIAQYVVTWTYSFEEAVTLSKKALSALRKYVKHELYCKLELSIYLNSTVRLLKADYYEVDQNREVERSKDLEKTFNECTDNILALCEAEREEFKIYKIMTLIRIALFKRDFKTANKQLKGLKVLDKDLHKAMKTSITAYSANTDFINSSNQLNVICGMNMRIAREARDLTMADIADLLSYSEANIGSMERGETPVTIYSLYKLAKSYDLTVNDFLYRVIKDRKFDKENIALEKLKVMTSGLDDEEMKFIFSVIKHVQSQKRRLEKRVYTAYSNDDDTEE
jgi:transcriptional regulator with XRE-family HTH domain